jgi:hypothetical protein
MPHNAICWASLYAKLVDFVKLKYMQLPYVDIISNNNNPIIIIIDII